MIKALAFAVDTTTVRLGLLILVPMFSFIGSMLGVIKLLPERSKIIIEFQVKALEAAANRERGLVETIARLELRVELLEKA